MNDRTLTTAAEPRNQRRPVVLPFPPKPAPPIHAPRPAARKPRRKAARKPRRKLARPAPIKPAPIYRSLGELAANDPEAYRRHQFEMAAIFGGPK